MNVEEPKVFISYAWKRQKTQDDVIELATRLVHDGVDVVLDKWDLKEGGVGDETVVISPEVYGNMKQTKFIPLIFERDENNEPFMPVYLKSKKYIDFSNEDNYEKSYEELLRILYAMPFNKKPKKGSKPAWLSNDEVNYNELTVLTKALKRGATEQEQKYNTICTDFTDNFILMMSET